MNYEQARQIGPDGPAPGKWNWTNLTDSVQAAPYTIAPCAWPDDRPDTSPRYYTDPPARTGRERCDHDTREEAERHHWRYELGQVRLRKLDLATLRQRSRCDVPGCPDWETHRAVFPDGYISDSLCDIHATHEDQLALHPFVPGVQEIHS